MSKYQQGKERTRQKAIEAQQQYCNMCWSYANLLSHYNYFFKLGKRYGLLKEFKENGII